MSELSSTKESSAVKRHFVSWKMKIALACAVLLALLKFVIIPLSAWSDKQLAEIAVLKKEIARKKVLAHQEDQVIGRLALAEKTLVDTKALFQTEFTDPRNLQLKLQTQIEKIALENDVVMQSADWVQPLVDEIIQAPVTFRFQGAPDHLLNLLAAVENHSFFLSIDRLRIMVRKKAAMLQVEVDISAYGRQESGE